MRILDVIQRSADFLARKGVSSPRLQVELLLAHLLKMPRMQLYLNFERKLTDAEMDALRALVVRRGQREPLQYIVGSTSFCGLEMAVTRDVLIPRPETELLAERAWTFLQKRLGGNPPDDHSRTEPPESARPVGVSCSLAPLGGERARERGSAPAVSGGGSMSPDAHSNLKTSSPQPSPPQVCGGEGEGTASQVQGFPADVQALEIGTGSGCLAIALAHHAPKARICAVDCSAGALEVARRNAENHHVSERIHFCQGDLFPSGPVEACFDLIVSNPPYIPSARIGTLEPEVRAYEPRGALDGGADGQDFYRRIARGAGAWLKPGGCIMLELDDEGAAATAQIFESEKWTVEAVQKDYDGHARILVARMA